MEARLPFKITSPDVDREVPVPTPELEGLQLAWQEGFSQTPVGALIRAVTLGDFKSGEIKQPGDLNKEYPFLDTFTEPTDAGIAKEMADRYFESQERQAAIARGPEGLTYGLATFAAEMLPHALDPTNIATGMGVAKLVGKAAFAANIMKAGEAAGATRGAVAAKYALQAAEMTVGNIPGEAAAQMVNSYEHRDASVEMALINSVVGAGFGVGLNIGAKTAKAGVMRLLNKKGAKVENLAFSTGVAQMMEGRPPSTDVIVETLVKETGHDYGHPHTPMTAEVAPDKFYVSLDDPSGNIAVGKVLAAGQDHFGDDLIHLTDNPHVANAEAGSHFRDTTGSVLEVEVGEAKLFNLDDPPPGYEGVSREILFSDEKIAMAPLIEMIKADGFDGFHYVVDELAGKQHSPHNALVLFDTAKEKLKITNTMKADRSKVKAMSHEEMVKTSLEAEKSRFANDSFDEPPKIEPKELKAELETSSKAFKEKNKLFDEKLKELEDMNALPYDLKLELDELRVREKMYAAENDILKNAIACRLGVLGG